LEEIIEENEKIFRANYGEDVPIENHPFEVLRAVINPLRAIAIAEKYKARLHILHLTTETETLVQKRYTS
jgi:dihydroorotase